MADYSTEQLSKKTWPDFEHLFSQGGGWDFCGCMLHQRGCHLAGRQFRARAAARVQNLRDKRDLVWQGRAHGILVYRGRDAVGWCQYGPVDELPIPGGDRLDRGVRERLRLGDPDAIADPADWRIPCFVTRKDHRRNGVASLALAAALDAIRREGGGLVEATPIAGSHYDYRYHEIVHAYGRDSRQLRDYLKTWPTHEVPGVGPVPAARGGFGGVSHPGTVSMFQRAGFGALQTVRHTYVVMRRYLMPAK